MNSKRIRTLKDRLEDSYMNLYDKMKGNKK